MVYSILRARAAQHSVRVKCPGAAVARAALMEPGLGLTLRRCAQSSEAARAEHTRYIYTLSTISTVDTLHSSRQTTREKVDIWLREDLLICSASSSRVSWIFPIRYNWFVTRRRCRCDNCNTQFCRYFMSRWRCFLAVLKCFFYLSPSEYDKLNEAISQNAFNMRWVMIVRRCCSFLHIYLPIQIFHRSK